MKKNATVHADVFVCHCRHASANGKKRGCPGIAKKELDIYGFIGDNVTHAGLADVKVKLMRPDSTVIDSMQVHPNMSVLNVSPVWAFSITAEGRYLLYFEHPQYEPKWVALEAYNFRRREYTRKYPPVYLQRRMKERKLGEAVVTATKVKFYAKGGTLVFNADAFQLQEGSMLDALIRQLPGVELKDDGRIYVNGQYVENLLLNGEDFFKKDHSILLDNLPTYMVNTVQVYDKAGRLSEMMGRDAGDKQLVMDVKLKNNTTSGGLPTLRPPAARTSAIWRGCLPCGLRTTRACRFSAP